MSEFTLTSYDYPDPFVPERVRQGFAAQQVMQLINARLLDVAPGMVSIGLDYQHSLTQQHGYLHAGILTTLVDSACGFAAFSLMPSGSQVLSVEFKVNFMSPARGQKFLATGRVIKPGRTIMVCSGEVHAFQDGVETTVALMQATMIRQSGQVVIDTSE